MRKSSEPTGADPPGTVLPDYSGGSILNLMRSIGEACGAPASSYEPLRGLETDRLAQTRVIVLLVIDGLGLEYLCQRGRGGALWRHLAGALTSVFPSTTASAVTTFLTGLAPQQHALTGWHMHFEEIDCTLASLPLTPRDPAGRKLGEEPLAPRLFDHAPLSARTRRRCFNVSPAVIADSEFNAFHTTGARRVPYTGMEEMFDHVEALARAATEPTFIYAYYPELDALAHRFGIASGEAQDCLARLDRAFGRFLSRNRRRPFAVLATADHGFIDSPPERSIDLESLPGLAATLARPLCGERRVAYCYVREGLRREFEQRAAADLGHAATIHRGEDLIAAGWYGPGAAHPRLAGRVGDYVLVMRENWTLVDWMPGEKRFRMTGVHGGVSAREMLVPLVAWPH